MAVAGAAFGEVAQEETLDAGHAYGQCLDVPAQVSEVASDFLPKALNICTKLGAKAPDAVSTFLTQAVDFRADFGAKGAEVATRVVPLRHYQRSQNRAYDQGCDEFR